jgi:hypothetical protein
VLIAMAIAAFAAYVPIFRGGSSRLPEQARVLRILPRCLDAAVAGDMIGAQI